MTSLNMILVFMPLMIVFTKVIPKNVEATVFAFLAGTYNLSTIISGLIGAWINETIVGVTNEDLSLYFVLNCIGIGTGFSIYFFYWLLPTKD